jgi:hypothetical protein
LRVPAVRHPLESVFKHPAQWSPMHQDAVGAIAPQLGGYLTPPKKIVGSGLQLQRSSSKVAMRSGHARKLRNRLSGHLLEPVADHVKSSI